MNKIYKAFDSIKLDDKIKEKAYRKLEKNHVTTNYLSRRNIIYGTLGLVFTSVFLLLFVNEENKNSLPNDAREADTSYILTSSNDVFLYNGNMYSLNESYDISTIKINNKIGILKQVNEEEGLVNNFDSYYHNGYLVYSSGNPKILIVKSKSETFIYER
jgi:hypothetical protein